MNNTIVNHNLFALKLKDASGAYILSNLFDNNSDGLSLDNSDDIIINGNICTHSINKAMTIKFGENITLESNYYARNEIGLDIRFFRNVLVSNNTFLKNREYGIKIFNILDSIFSLNTIKKNN